MIAAAALAVALQVVPLFRFLSLPLQYLNAHLHEMSHAVLGVLTGADVGPIRVNADASGVTLIRGGSLVLVGSAGYLGASAIGAVAIYTSRTPIGARRTLVALALALTFSMAIWVRGEPVGVGAGIAWIGVLLVGSRLFKGSSLVFFAQFLGMLQCVSSVESLFVVLQISAFSNGHSDAKLLEQATGAPAVVWSLLWCALSLAAMGIAAKWGWRKPGA